MKKFNIGLVIGKFYPFHLGHQYLIQTALNESKKVVVIICQTDRYQIPVKLRAKWIKNTFPKVKIKIFHHSKSMDSDSPKVSKIWAKATTDFLGYAPDAVFSSEKYGNPYAAHMGSVHRLVDLNRKHIPISATKIRSDLNKYWDYLSSEAKAYYALHIVCVGAESTGTTTLTKDLAHHFQTSWVPEYGRTYYEGKMTSPYLNTWTTNEFVHIAKMQNQMEEELAKQANKILVCDTNSFATQVWHERYVGFMSSEVSKVAKKTRADLYILTNTDIPFVQDGTRDGEHQRQNMHNRFLEELKKQNLKYIVVSGSKKKRLDTAITEINKLLKAKKRDQVSLVS